MKKINALWMLFLLLTPGGFAQQIGIQAGLNVSDMLFVYRGRFDQQINKELRPKTGVQLGLMLAFPLGKVLELETGAMLSSKGSKLSTDETGGNTFLYAEIPLRMRVNLQVGPMRMYLAGGHYLSWGIKGTYNERNALTGEVSTFSYWHAAAAGRQQPLRRLDVGLSVQAGFRFGPAEAGGYYSQGLTNLYTTSGFPEQRLYHRLVGIAVAYRFEKP